MNNGNVFMGQELDDILFHLEYAQKGVLYLEEEGVIMKTVKQNLSYLIEDVRSIIGDKQNDQSNT